MFYASQDNGQEISKDLIRQHAFRDVKYITYLLTATVQVLSFGKKVIRLQQFTDTLDRKVNMIRTVSP